MIILVAESGTTARVLIAILTEGQLYLHKLTCVT